MIAMYEKYGYYKDVVTSITMKGIEGLDKIQNIMNELRKNPPTQMAGYEVLSARDYKADTIRNLKTGEVTPTGLPASNVLYYDMTGNAWLCVRPSGTEPKIKFYFGIVGKSLEDADAKAKEMAEAVSGLVEKLS